MNPKAFAIQNATKAERRVRRKEDITEKKTHQPLVDRTPIEPPPVAVAVVGPPKVGKSTLVRCLVKNFTRQTLTNIQGPVTLVSGKKRRLTLIECPNDINSMIDVAKVADLALLLVDASFGFEMEIFEFLNVCQVHGFPRIMGVLTHLDTFKNSKTLQRTKKNLKQRFWTEVYQGAKLFYLSGMVHGDYQKTEIHNLGRFISVMKFRPLTWRTTHPYLLTDRLEDVTDPELLRSQPKTDRTVSVYGYLRGTYLKAYQGVHLAGVGDFSVDSMTFLPDPCPLPEGIKKRSLVEKDKSIYAPMSGVGGIVYDKDAVYIDLGGSHAHEKKESTEDSDYVQSIINTESTLNDKLGESELRLFSDSKPIKSNEVTTDRERRKVIFNDKSDNEGNDSDSDDDEEEDSDDDDDDPPTKKLKLSSEKPLSRNQQMLKEIGEEFGDEDESDDEDSYDIENSTANNVTNNSTLNPRKLATEKDAKVQNKISEALSAINDTPEQSSDEDNDDDGEGENDGSSNDSDDDNDESGQENSDNEEEDTLFEDNEEGESLKWKNGLAMKARDSFYTRQSETVSLQKLVYGLDKHSGNGPINDDDEDDEIGGMFTVNKSKSVITKKDIDGIDSSLWIVDHIQDWNSEEIRERIKDCFVTGQWAKSNDAEELLKLDDEEEVYGDFEDLETGEVVKADDISKGEVVK